jgi:hypothetical protein
MVGEDAERSLEMLSVDDEEPVEAFETRAGDQVDRKRRRERSLTPGLNVGRWISN